MKPLSLLLLVLLSLGCAPAPLHSRTELEIATPPSWNSTAGSSDTPLAAWWEPFGDPHLAQLIELTHAQNPDLRAAAHRVDRALALARIQAAELKPQVGAEFNSQRQKQVFVGLPIPGAPGVLSTTSTSFGLNLQASWEPDLWGRLRAGKRAALADAQSAAAELDAARLSLGGQAAKLWFAVAASRQQVELAHDTVQSFTRSAELVRARYERGVRPSIELRLALANQYNAEALVALAESNLDATLRQLEVLLGRYPSATLLDQFEAQALPDLPPAVPVGLPSELVARRPDLVAAERRLSAADQRLLVAQRARYPRFALTARGGSASDQLGDLLDGDFSVWGLVGNLAAPIFQGGRLKANVSQADSASQEQLELYVGQVLRAYSEVETALAAEHHLRSREASLSATVEQLSGAVKLAETRYTRGVGDYLTVLESQSRELNARVAWIGVRRELLTNRVDLHLALGGSFEPNPNTPNEEPQS